MNQLLHDGEDLPRWHEYQENVNQMRAKLNSFYIQISHKVDKHEVEFGATEWSQVIVVEGPLAQIELVCEFQELHAERLFHSLVINKTFG